jgi:hypothetical protein
MKDATDRKKHPLWSGLLKYFPDALLAVANCSFVGGEQHNPGQRLHWARGKSADQEDALLRHLLESGTVDTDGVRHSAKVAWRALAMLQLEIEKSEDTEHATIAHPPPEECLPYTDADGESGVLPVTEAQLAMFDAWRGT